MNMLIILFLIHVTITSCSRLIYSSLSYDLQFENALEWFPWMAVITDGKSMFYGTIVHERAVLTLAVFKIGQLYSDFHVKYDIYRQGDYPRFKNQPHRNIQEYNIIESNEKNYQNNLAILIVDKPFPPVQPHISSSRVIPLVENQEDIDYANCITLSLRSFRIDSADYVRIIYAIEGVFTHGMFYITTHGNDTIYDDQGRKEHLTLAESPDEAIIDINGGPVVCRSKKPTRHWIQNSVIKLNVFLENNSTFVQRSWARFIGGIPIKNAVEKILQIERKG